MLTYFPKYFTNKAIVVYFITLAVVSFLFLDYIMQWYWFVFGAVEVVSFFYFANLLSQKWSVCLSKTFSKKLFSTALIIRILYVIFSYFFYESMTGTTFEFSAGDATFYNEMGQYGHKLISQGNFNLLYQFNKYTGGLNYSDSGYPIYLSFIYFLTDDSIFLTRIIKAVFSAYTCVLIYKLATRNFGENTGRMSAIFCMLMPNLIYYCGMHLKEIEMTFLIVLFIERADAMFRGNRLKLGSILVTLIIGLSLFMFRTALGATAILTLFVTLVLSSTKLLALWKKIVLGIITVACLAITTGEQIRQETQELWQNKGNNQETSMQSRATRKGGNVFASKVSAAVFAPLIFTIPFPTMVETKGQENQRMIHGGNYVKNIISFFTIFALILLLFSGDWRKHVLPTAFMCGYLMVIAFSAFAQSERFHMPALPFALMFAAYGVSQMQNKYKRWYILWLLLIFVALIGWNWFKLKGRGAI